MVPPCQDLAGWITALRSASDLKKKFNRPHLTNVGASLQLTMWIYCLCFFCNYKWLHPAKHLQHKDKTHSDETIIRVTQSVTDTGLVEQPSQARRVGNHLIRQMSTLTCTIFVTKPTFPLVPGQRILLENQDGRAPQRRPQIMDTMLVPFDNISL